MSSAVLAVRAKAEKASIYALVHQVVGMTGLCINNNAKIVDCAFVFSGTKELIKELKKIDARKRFDYVVIYSPAQIAESKEEFTSFVDTVEQQFKCRVTWLRSG